MSLRIGRPTDNPRRERLGIRLTEEELRKLQVCYQKTGKSKTEVISEGVERVYERVSNKK